MSWATSLSPSSDQGDKFVAQLALIQYELGDKFVANIGAGRQVCRPSRAELGLKDWAIVVAGPKMLSRNHFFLFRTPFLTEG
jgi:hypothetical protein